jgi:hypothetical protein
MEAAASSRSSRATSALTSASCRLDSSISVLHASYWRLYRLTSGVSSLAAGRLSLLLGAPSSWTSTHQDEDTERGTDSRRAQRPIHECHATTNKRTDVSPPSGLRSQQRHQRERLAFKNTAARSSPSLASALLLPSLARSLVLY